MEDISVTRIMPNSLEAEQSVILNTAPIRILGFNDLKIL